MIGRGSFSKVYLIIKREEGQPEPSFYALKVIKKAMIFKNN